MSVLLIAGSPTRRSRSAGLLEVVGQQLAAQGVDVVRLAIRDIHAQALLHADFQHPDVIAATEAVEWAQALVIATPVYKAAYSGALKAWLDVLPQSALQGKTVLPLATGGSPHHMLALDYALRPVLQSLGARQILAGIYATDAQVLLPEAGQERVQPQVQPQVQTQVQLAEALQQRVDAAVQLLWTECLQPLHFPPVHFSQVRCSV